MKLKKGKMTGTLKLVQVENVTSKRASLKNILTIIGNDGTWLTPCETFRSNATKKALNHFKNNGWQVDN